ncbi:hypothetical protein [Psychromonas sp.]
MEHLEDDGNGIPPHRHSRVVLSGIPEPEAPSATLPRPINVPSLSVA